MIHLDKSVTKTIPIHAPVTAVWDVVTNPLRMSKWMAEDEFEVISEWKVGSPIVFDWTLHGKKYRDHGIIQQFEPGKVFQYSYWTKLNRLPDRPENYSLIEFRLDEEPEHTLLTVTHSNIALEAAYKHSNFLWAMALDRIKKLAEKIS